MFEMIVAHAVYKISMYKYLLRNYEIIIVYSL